MLSARTGIAVRLLAIVALAALTAGCFQPMYAEHADGTPGLRDKLLTVDVPPIDKPNASREARVGVAIRKALAFKLYGNATETLNIDAQYNLIEIATDKSVMTGTTFSHLSYDIPGSYQRFSRARAFRDAEDRAAEEIAEHIQTRLASFFYAGT